MSFSSSRLLFLPAAFLLVFIFFFVSSPTSEKHIIEFFSNFIPLREDKIDPSNNLAQFSPILVSPLASTNISKILQDDIIKKINIQEEAISNISSTNFVKRIVSFGREKSSLEKVEEDLARARAAIRKAVKTRKYNLDNNESFIPKGSIYRNPHAFHQSHKEMVKRFKVWTYREGQPPIVHNGPMNNIYAIEGQFMDELESQRSSFRASHPDEAHAFFLPFSVANVIHYVYSPILTKTEFGRERLQRLLTDYILVLADKYPHWNRSKGADHFMVSCHDWAPDVSDSNPKFYNDFIRVLCNANVSEGFHPKRDVALPEIYLPFGKLGPPNLGQDPSKRSILAFFSGGAHGDIRKILLSQWRDKDNEVQVFQYLPKGQNYNLKMGQSKYCLCPSGYEVASPRIVEAIYAGCVPVIISSNYSLPFSDVLNWSHFSVDINVDRVPDIKIILQGISHDDYLKMYKNVMQVQRHFVLNRPAKPYDVIHMVLHSVWLRRLNLKFLP